MAPIRSSMLLAALLLTLSLAQPEQSAAQGAKLRFGVGPLQPTPTETKKAYEPFFAYLAKSLGRDFDLTATTDWAGISVALANNQVDVAWMGPWGYILANADSGVRAIATAKYDGKPIYHAIVVCRPGLVKGWPEGAKGKRVSFADVGSTSGWLIPTAWFKAKAIDPKQFFAYSDGATHAANEISVASGQVDCATDFDRNRNTMIESGRLDKSATEVHNVLAGRLAVTPTWRVLLRRFSHADRQLALRGLDTVGLLDRAYARADHLSGGQQQRVAIARALAQDARVILADEPVASLDPESAATVLQSLRAAAEAGVAVVASLHQVDLARAYADRIVAMRDGRVVEDAPAAAVTARTIELIYAKSADGLAKSADGLAKSADAVAKFADGFGTYAGGRADSPDDRTESGDGVTKPTDRRAAPADGRNGHAQP